MGKQAALLQTVARTCKKLSLQCVNHLDDDPISVVDRLGKQLTTLVLDGYRITDEGYSYLNNCAR